MQVSKFRSWILIYGIDNLTVAIRSVNPRAAVSRRSVERWIVGTHEPRGERMRAIVRVAGGEVSANDVLEHFELTRAAAAAKGRFR
jgi:DNA-binding transcriptional regulator YdaS (Cro superfamily)